MITTSLSGKSLEMKWMLDNEVFVFVNVKFTVSLQFDFTIFLVVPSAISNHL